MEVSGSRELKLFPGTARGAAFKGFHYHSDVGARAVQLKVNKDAETGLPDYEQDTVVNYFNGGGVFIDANKYPNTKVLATYADPVEVEDPSKLQAAVIICKVGEGRVMLSGTHPEFTPDLLHESGDAPNMSRVIKALRIHDKSRLEFLRCCLKKMGLKVNDSSAMVRPSLTPLYLSSVDNGVSASQLVKALEEDVGYHIQSVMNCGGDRFKIIKGLSAAHEMEQKEFYEDPDAAIKDLVLCSPGELPDLTFYNLVQTLYMEKC
ncbi:unnamed protein product [Ambrosiozyma monospora]|uniref:Unnamed protein product n=1 Tax=Ambrosiozyma monospora TaxID=43982 RepID=A0ACB5U3I8_AMBMO|nr:unnamed protein product [Ambrosiozyma monospora]